MADGFGPDDPEYDLDGAGEHDELAALDFSAPRDPDEGSGLDALAGYVAEPAEEADESPESSVPLFTVTNPPGTVTVTTSMDGGVQQIDLAPKAADMTERDLAEEIVVIAGLATQDARAAQHAFMHEGMTEQGHDPVTTRDFLTRDLQLPTPDQAKAERAEVFATRYGGGHD